VIIGSIVGAIVAIGAAFAIRASGQTPSTLLLAIGTVLLAAPLAYAGYHFLRSDELGGYTGIELLTRTAICSAVFAATWAVYYMLGLYFGHKTMADISVAEMAIFMGIMVGIGAFASFATLELEAGQAVLHYFLFFIVTFLLANTAGVTLGEPLANPDQKTQRQVVAPAKTPQSGTIPARGTTPTGTTPAGTAPAGTGTAPAGTTPAGTAPKPNAPNSKS
jgi:hypothetical protein